VIAKSDTGDTRTSIDAGLAADIGGTQHTVTASTRTAATWTTCCCWAGTSSSTTR
jgi:hypothetical protein